MTIATKKDVSDRIMADDMAEKRSMIPLIYTEQSKSRIVAVALNVKSSTLQVPVDLTAQTDNPNNGDWQEEVYQKKKAIQKLYLLESDDWKAQLQDSSSLPSALPPGNDVQNMSGGQQNQLSGQQYNYLVSQDHPLYQEQLRQLLQ
ncbi:hypothetical protein Hanom_Chr03g00252561 [Helianthus anomalus]